MAVDVARDHLAKYAKGCLIEHVFGLTYPDGIELIVFIVPTTEALALDLPCTFT